MTILTHAAPSLEGIAGEVPNSWAYDTAFQRNRGLVSESEQQLLRDTRVAIAGMGGVGGVHLVTLARLGIGKFTIADPDTFDVANFNRQYGATTSSVGRNKAEVMAEIALSINPELEIDVFKEPVDAANVDRFLSRADIFVDGLDFFAIAARRLTFAMAAKQGIWAVTAGPIGNSTAWLLFDPAGMAFDTYFDLHEQQDQLDQLIAFAVGLTPKATHRNYMDFSQVKIAERSGPSLALACQLAGGVMAGEVLKVLTKRGNVRPAPCYAQFDIFHNRLKQGKLWLGNRDPRQRIKRALFKRFLAKQVGE